MNKLIINPKSLKVKIHFDDNNCIGKYYVVLYQGCPTRNTRAKCGTRQH